MSQPALKPVGRVLVQRIATPIPRTRSRAEVISQMLADTEARIDLAWTLAQRDLRATVEWPAFGARLNALLFDLETAMELMAAMEHVARERAPELRARREIVLERRSQARKWIARFARA
jgi:hypothetical protein